MTVGSGYSGKGRAVPRTYEMQQVDRSERKSFWTSTCHSGWMVTLATTSLTALLFGHSLR